MPPMTETARESGAGDKLGAATDLGRLALNVEDLAVVAPFYETGVGLARLEDAGDRLLLGSHGRPVLELYQRPELPRPTPGSAGLYHTAILFDERSDLAAALYATALGFGGSFTGSADHLVSQAFYFNDPEGNGVELYWDRPRSEWRWSGGEVAMDSLPLDPNSFIREHAVMEGSEPKAPEGAHARLGHVHLKVGDVATARAFYVDTLGFDVTASMWHSALFASAGGYHHHLGMNVWESRGAAMRGDTLGLAYFEVQASASDLAAARERLERAGVAIEEGAGYLGVRDPWGTLVKLRT